MLRRRTLLAAVAVACSACADGGDSCTDTYADGPNYSFSGTSCGDKTPTPEIAVLPTPEEVAQDQADACLEIFAFTCDDDGTNCRDEYARQCPGGVMEKTLEPGCRKTGGPVYTFDGLGTSSRDALNFRFDGGLPWKSAITLFNDLFVRANKSPALSYAQEESNRSPTDGAGFRVPPDISEFRFFATGHDANFPNAAGLTLCSSTELFGRRGCIETLFAENINKSAALTGHRATTIATVTALHELGHVACIQHFNTNVNVPHTGLSFTAMNSFLLTDTVNDIGFYLNLDPTELDDAIAAFNLGRTLPDPNIVFERGFNQD